MGEGGWALMTIDNRWGKGGLKGKNVKNTCKISVKYSGIICVVFIIEFIFMC